MKKIYLGLFLISLATLSLEISLIRLFSISLWYHFAFLVVSIAMLGLAAAGTFLSIKKLKNPLPISSILFSLTTIIGLTIINYLPFDPFKAALDPWYILILLLYYILLGLPFFFSGIIITFILTKFQSLSGRIYFFNLAGSAVGSLAVLPLISSFGEKTILVIALIGLISSFCFSFKKTLMKLSETTPMESPVSSGERNPPKLEIKRERRWINSTNLINLSLIIILIILITSLSLPIKTSPYKELSQALNFEQAEIEQTEWNSFSKVDVVDSPYVRYAPGLSAQFKNSLPEQKGITIDGTSLNAITKKQDLEFFNYLPTSIPFSLMEKPKTLVINAGAGLDVLMALENGSEVTAVESNLIIIDLLKTEYKDFSGDIFNQAEIIHDDGRSYIKKTGQYDTIIISLAGQLTSSTGLYSMVENYLFTEESFQDYFEHLTEDGILVITRWLTYPPKESLRLFSLALTVPKAENKIAMFRSWTTVTLLLNKNDLSRQRLNKITAFTEKNNFDLIYLPQTEFTPNQYAQFEEPYYYQATKQILENKQEFYKNYLFDVSPTTDEKPFYFNFFKWSKIKQLYQLIGTKWQPFLDSGFLLVFLFIQAVILSLVFVLLPVRFLKKLPIKKKNLIYFLCIGLGYLFVEIVLIQKFILFLGHVMYAMSAVIFAVLLFSSFGSLVSQKYSAKKLPWIISVLAVLIIVYLLILPIIINSLITYSLTAKIIFSVLIISPLAFFMGMPFPLGLRAINHQVIPWALAVNGSASVLSAILAVLIALSVGYSFVLILAAFVYLVGIFFIRTAASP